MQLDELTDLYQQCFPHKNAEAELQSFTNVFKYDILDSSAFIIYNVISEDEAEIFDIGTIPSRRQNGLGKKIMFNTFKKLKDMNVNTVYLEVAENNLAAMALYVSCGFERYNIRKDYYKSADGPINAILLKKSI